MSSNFDPYHVWLGIPPKYQPPHHYRLLGLELYEESADVIDAAANRQTSYLQEMASGPNRRHSQELLNEIAAARRCLLDADRKKRYDEKLRKQLGEADTQANGPGTADQLESKQSVHDGSTVITPVDSDALKSAVEADKRAVDGQNAAQSGVGGETTVGKKPNLPKGVSKRKIPAKGKAAEPSSAESKAEKKKNQTPIIIAACGVVCLISIIIVVSSGGDQEKPKQTVAGVSGAGAASQQQGTQSNGGQSASDPDSQDKKPKGNGSVIDKDLLAYFSFDEKSPDLAMDYTDSSRHASADGSPTFIDEGPFGAAIRLDGKDDRLKIPGSANIGTAGSFAFWVRVDGELAKRNLPLVSSTNQELIIDLREGRLVARAGKANQELVSEAQLEKGKWYHLALMWAANKSAELFVNGNSVAKSNIGSIARENPILMGNREQPQNVFAAVTVDDVRCYKMQIDSSRIKTIMSDSKVAAATPKKAPRLVAQVDTKKTDSKKKNGKAKDKNAKSKKNAAPPKPKGVDVVMPKVPHQLVAEYWKAVSGNNIGVALRRINEQPKPDGFRHISKLSTDGLDSLGDNYIQRVTGYLLVPATGQYTFHPAADDLFDFKLATVSGHRDWKKAENASKLKPIAPQKLIRRLQANQAYYFEFIHKENSGSDSFNVGWTKPDGSKDDTIGSEYLAWQPGAGTFVTSNIIGVRSQPKVDFVQPSGSVLVVANNKVARDTTYHLRVKTSLDTITGIRIEALPHESLKYSGPGLGPAGMFSVNEVSATIGIPGQQQTPIEFQAPRVDAAASSAKFLVDGDAKSAWRVPSDRQGKGTGMILIPKTPIKVAPDSELTLSLNQQYNIGRLRVRVTAMEMSRIDKVARQYFAEANKKFTLYANLGGERSISRAEGSSWRPAAVFKEGSWGYVGGNAKRVGNHNTSPHLSSIEGISEFKATVPNGTYNVVLHFCDHWNDAPNKRRFAIRIGRKTVPLDVVQAAGGKGKPFLAPGKLVVKNRQLEIKFVKGVGAPILAAVSIEEQ